MSTTTNLSNSVRARYRNDYIDGALAVRLYDQFCYPILQDREKMQRASSIVVPFLSAMTPGTTAISETIDITPQTLTDATATLTPSSRGEAIQDSELLLLQNYTEYGQKRYEILGQNMIETLENYLLSTAMNGSVYVRAAARASLDAGTSGHRLSDSTFAQVARLMHGLKCPEFPGVMGQGGSLAAIMHMDAYYDLLTGGNIVSIAQYQAGSIILNQELGYLAPFRIIASPWAKVFAGAGAAYSTDVDTTTGAAISALDTTFTITSSSDLDGGYEYLNIGTVESSSTLYPTNERVRYVSNSTTTVTIVGQGDNGGFKYAHANGSTVNVNDSVYPILFAGPNSVAKAYASDVGEYGAIVGPKEQGLANQWVSLAWKWYGGFARISENWLARAEVSSSLDA